MYSQVIIYLSDDRRHFSNIASNTQPRAVRFYEIEGRCDATYGGESVEEVCIHKEAIFIVEGCNSKCFWSSARICKRCDNLVMRHNTTVHSAP